MTRPMTSWTRPGAWWCLTILGCAIWRPLARLACYGKGDGASFRADNLPKLICSYPLGRTGDVLRGWLDAP